MWTYKLTGTNGWDTLEMYLDGVKKTSNTLTSPITTISGSFFGFGAYGGT